MPGSISIKVLKNHASQSLFCSSALLCNCKVHPGQSDYMLLRIAPFWASRLIFFCANKQNKQIDIFLCKVTKAFSGGTSYLAALLHPLIYFLFHPLTFLGNSTRNKIHTYENIIFIIFHLFIPSRPEGITEGSGRIENN